MKKYDILDLTKIILCIMVVAIHTKLLPMILYPWIRLAVPIFFIISSYLLHIKINNTPKEDKNNVIKHYITRLLKLYLFWFIALLPITIYVRRSYFDNGILIGILNIIIRPFTGSTFIASWYITATIIGTLLINKLSCRRNNKILPVIFTIIYIICCCSSSYSFIFENQKIIEIISPYVFIEPHNSFMVGLIYILFGKIIAENKLEISKKTNIILIIIGSILLYIEWLTIYKINGTYNNDCYLMLMPTAILIFNYIKDIKIDINNSKVLRQFSNFTYPLHGSVAIIINFILEKIIKSDIINGILNFGITLSICIIAFIAVNKFEDRIKILKYSH